ncbi:amino acid ABC transporter permease [Paenibacillus sacheonensis]|uniref:ABC transporter permease subunit n=1 Tax=Paenibacillus sacheonensis TaxID=742054 RepID=A0A7X4YU99_9BACL|nr:amino acid ABC transporter permease [Paenibacillus sacheonensis]MBM7566745.1 L-cystine transport system permease protein [Paenibacillus sacheonensis]NBC71679.1 ABC transporter permease subunit [Paenibacillus sacheonensis]
MKLDPSFIWEALVKLLPVIPTSLLITAVSVLCGFVIGTVAAFIRIYKVPVLHPIASAYVTFIRGTPMLTHLLIIYFGLPLMIDALSSQLGLGFRSASIPMIDFAFIAFSLTAGGYMSEVVRSGLLTVNRGQIEAAYAVGMTTPQAIRRIVFPQAMAASIPNLSNAVIGMLHASTLAFTVSVVELFAKAQIVASTNWKFFEAYLAAAIIFWGLTVLIERVAVFLEKRVNSYNRGGVA